MHFGACFFPTAYAISPLELGPALEERGFESVWLAEHSHIPASRTSPWPGGPDLPQMYYDTLDPFVTLGAMAATTTTLRLGTGITLVVERDPIHTAKEVASLDVLSGGRVLFGVGAGWNLEEMADHGTDPDRRFGLMRERVEAMKAIWTSEVAEYHGNQVSFDPMYQNPKPVQSPHPPVHVGGVAPGGCVGLWPTATGGSPSAAEQASMGLNSPPSGPRLVRQPGAIRPPWRFPSTTPRPIRPSWPTWPSTESNGWPLPYRRHLGTRSCRSSTGTPR